MSDVLERVRRAFASEPRPEHFTDYRHCCECSEHDDTLRAHTPDSIGLEQLGSPGWDPICFTHPQAYRHYFPALARLALGRGMASYLDQFLFGLLPERVATFTEEQRAATEAFLRHLLERFGEDPQAQHDLPLLQERLQQLASAA